MKLFAKSIAVCFLSTTPISAASVTQNDAPDSTAQPTNRESPGIDAVAKVHRSALPPVTFSPSRSVAENNQRLLDRSPLQHLLVRVGAADLKLSPRGAIGTPVKFQTATGSFFGEVFALGKSHDGRLELYVRLANRQHSNEQGTWMLVDGTTGRLTLSQRDVAKQKLPNRRSVPGAGLR